MKIRKLKSSIENSLWQTLPMVSTLILSLLIVRLFSVSFWGNIVSILVIQQIVNGILVWGNKDYLQRELAQNHNGFGSKFSQLFIERIFISLVIFIIIYYFEVVNKPYFISFLLLVFFKFISQSFDILVIKQRKFFLVFIIDFFILLTQILLVFFFNSKNSCSINNILILFWLPLLLKSVLLFIIFRKEFGAINFNKLLLIESFFFGMLTFSGLIHSKIDLLYISKIVESTTVGEYQIIIAFLWSIQSLSMFISSPFIHNFYRLSQTSQSNSSKLLKILGLIIVPIAITITMFILFYIFNISINLSIIIASLLFSISSFIYLPWVFQINQNKQEYLVLIVNLIGSLVLICMLFSANYFWNLTLEILIWTITIHQAFITIALYFAKKTSKNGV